MNSWRDYLAPDALLPAAGWLVAAFFALRGLWLTKNDSRRRFLEYGGYSLATIVIAGWYNYQGVQNLRANRETQRSLQTLLALSGVSSDNVNQGLDQLITRNLQPRQIIPTQEEVLAKQFEFLKGEIPKRFAISVLHSATGYDYGIAYAVQRAFGRNGVNLSLISQTASTPRETGIMFTMPNPSDPPDFALGLRDAFGMAGIREIRFVAMDPDIAAKYDFTIFIGPAPLN